MTYFEPEKVKVKGEINITEVTHVLCDQTDHRENGLLCTLDETFLEPKIVCAENCGTKKYKCDCNVYRYVSRPYHLFSASFFIYSLYLFFIYSEIYQLSYFDENACKWIPIENDICNSSTPQTQTTEHITETTLSTISTTTESSTSINTTSETHTETSMQTNIKTTTEVTTRTEDPISITTKPTTQSLTESSLEITSNETVTESTILHPITSSPNDNSTDRKGEINLIFINWYISPVLLNHHKKLLNAWVRVELLLKHQEKFSLYELVS